VNYELVIKPNKNAIKEDLYLRNPFLMFQQIMNSPDDFNPEEFHNEKFDHKASRHKDAYYTVVAKQEGVCPMKVQHIRLSMDPYGSENGQSTDAVAHHHSYPLLLQGNRKFALVRVISAPIRKRKDLHFDFCDGN